MKNIVFILLLSSLTQVCLSQTLTLSGTINQSIEDSVELNIPFDHNYYVQNSLFLTTNAKGAFKFVLPGAKPRFVLLKYKKDKQWLLLSPNRPLHLSFDAGDFEGTIQFSGQAKRENEWMQKSNLNNSALWIRKLSQESSFKKWSADSLVKILLPTITQEKDAMLAELNRSGFPVQVQSSLVTEINYGYACGFVDFSNSIMQKLTRKGT